MSSSEQFCLKWKNFEYNIAAYLNSLRNGEEFVDVTITCGDQNFRAHKLILSACSPYFHNIFQDNPCKHPIIILKNVSPTEMDAILMYIYTGEAVVCQENISSFFATAHLLQIVGLTYENINTRKVQDLECGSKTVLHNGVDKSSKLNKRYEDIIVSDTDQHETVSNHDTLKSSVTESANKLPKTDFSKSIRSNILKNHLNKSGSKNQSNDDGKKLVSVDVAVTHEERDNEGNTKSTSPDNDETTVDNVCISKKLQDCETIPTIDRADFEERCPILSQQLLLPKKRKLSTADFNKNIEISEIQESHNKQLKIFNEDFDSLDKSSDDNCDERNETQNGKCLNDSTNFNEDTLLDTDSKGSASEILRNRLSEVVDKDSCLSSDTNIYKTNIFIKKEPDDNETDDSVQENLLEPEISVKEEFPIECDNDNDNLSYHNNNNSQGIRWQSFDDSSMNETCTSETSKIFTNNNCSEQKTIIYDTILKVPNPDVSLFSKTVRKDSNHESDSSHLTLTPNVEIFLKNTSNNCNNLLGNLGKTNFFQKSLNKSVKGNKKLIIKRLGSLPNVDISKVDNDCDKLLLPGTSKDEVSLIQINRNNVVRNTQRIDINKSDGQKNFLKIDNGCKTIVKNDGTQKNLHNNFNLTNFPCPHCKQPYNNLSALKYHVRLMHSDLENKLFCYLCPMNFIEREFFKLHLWETHNARF